MDKKPDKTKKKESKKPEKMEDHMKVSVEDLYNWIEYAIEKLESNEGRNNIKNAWRGSGYFESS